jgi:hypothetical protein
MATKSRDNPNTDKSCQKLARFLRSGKISFDDYASTVMMHLVCATDDNLSACVESIPPEYASAFVDYVRAELEPVDFMPSPGAFIVDFSVPGIEDRTKRELRPRYLRLYRAVCGDRSPIGLPTIVTASPQES